MEFLILAQAKYEFVHSISGAGQQHGDLIINRHAWCTEKGARNSLAPFSYRFFYTYLTYFVTS